MNLPRTNIAGMRKSKSGSQDGQQGQRFALRFSGGNLGSGFPDRPARAGICLKIFLSQRRMIICWWLPFFSGRGGGEETLFTEPLHMTFCIFRQFRLQFLPRIFPYNFVYNFSYNFFVRVFLWRFYRKKIVNQNRNQNRKPKS